MSLLRSLPLARTLLNKRGGAGQLKFRSVLSDAATAERKRSERARFHAARKLVAIDRAGKFQGHGHGRGDRGRPSEVIAIDLAVGKRLGALHRRLGAVQRTAVS